MVDTLVIIVDQEVQMHPGDNTIATLSSQVFCSIYLVVMSLLFIVMIIY